MSEPGHARKAPNRGPAIPWNDAQALAQAIPTQADLDAARAFWRQWVAAPLRDLLDASPGEQPNAGASQGG